MVACIYIYIESSILRSRADSPTAARLFSVACDSIEMPTALAGLGKWLHTLCQVLFSLLLLSPGQRLLFFSFFSFLNVFICCCFCFVFVGGGGLFCEYRLFFKSSKTYLNCYNNSNNNKTTTTTTTKWLNHFHVFLQVFAMPGVVFVLCFYLLGGGGWGLFCEYRLFFKNSKTYLNCYNNSNNNKTTTTTTTKWLNHFHPVFCLFLFCCFVVLVFCFVFHSFPLTECGIYCKSVYRNAVRLFSFNHISTPAPKGWQVSVRVQTVPKVNFLKSFSVKQKLHTLFWTMCFRIEFVTIIIKQIFVWNYVNLIYIFFFFFFSVLLLFLLCLPKSRFCPFGNVFSQFFPPSL